MKIRSMISQWRSGAVALILVTLLPSAQADADAEDKFKFASNLFRVAGDYATSAQEFAEFIRNYPGNVHEADARLLLARSLARSQRCGEAVPAYEAFYEQHSEHIDAAAARRERADCLHELGQYSRAAIGYEEVQRLYGEGQFAAESLLSAAVNYSRAEDLTNALRAYVKLLSEYATKPEARRGKYRLALLRFASGDPATAQALLASILESAPKSDDARNALRLSGNIDLVLNRAGSAQSTFSRLHETFPHSAHSDSSHLDLAGFYLGQGRYEDAIAAYSEADDSISDKSLGARARLGRADALRLSGQPAKSLEHYTTLVVPGSPIRDRANLGLAIALGQTDRIGAAVGIFLQLVQTPATEGASQVAAVRELGSLYRRQGDLARAASWFRRYLDDAQRSGDAFAESTTEGDLVRLQLAQVLETSGYHDDAVRLFEQLSRSQGPLAAEAQYGLAAAHDGATARRLAIVEYGRFLQRYPGHPRAAQVQQRIEYLREYTIVDPKRLARALQQTYVDELSGTSRQQTRLSVARALRDHQDFANAVRAWETFVASYPGDAAFAEAQFHLADCLYRLSRQRQLEGHNAAADSLHSLALQEDRILSTADAGRWSRLALLRQIESAAALLSDTARIKVLETGYTEFLAQHDLTDETADARGRALLGLGDARRQAAAGDSTRLAAAEQAYDQLLQEMTNTPLAHRARFGRAAVGLARGRSTAAIDTLSALLGTLSGSRLQPEALAVLGRALARAGRNAEAATRLGELLLAFPDYRERRNSEELLGDTYLALGDAARAAELFKNLAESDRLGDLDGSLRRRLAQALQEQAKSSEALLIYDRLLAEGAGAEDSLQLARGRVLAGLGRNGEAIAAFEEIRGTTLLPAARRGSADLHFAASQFKEAAATYGKLSADETDGEGMGHHVISLYESRQVKSAEKLAGQHQKRFGKQGIWPLLFLLYEGRSLLAQGEYDKAQKIFEKVSADAPKRPVQIEISNNVPVMMRRMASDLVSAGAFFAVSAQWEKMRAQPSEEGTAQALQAQSNFARQYPDSPFASDVYMRLAQFQLALDNLLPAAGAFRRVVDGTHGTLKQKHEAVWQLMRCYSNLYQWDEALRISQRIQSDFPKHPKSAKLQLEIGYILKEMGQHSQAINVLQRVLEWAEGEDAAEARYYIGQSYQNSGDYRKAIKFYYEVAFYGADASTQWINTADFKRARCNEELGEMNTALSIYNRIIQREGGGSEWGRLARQQIDLMPSSPRGN
jgi:TolA-binding protein